MRHHDSAIMPPKCGDQQDTFNIDKYGHRWNQIKSWNLQWALLVIFYTFLYLKSFNYLEDCFKAKFIKVGYQNLSLIFHFSHSSPVRTISHLCKITGNWSTLKVAFKIYRMWVQKVFPHRSDVHKSIKLTATCLSMFILSRLWLHYAHGFFSFVQINVNLTLLFRSCPHHSSLIK